MEQISTFIKRCRKEQHLTQPELAAKAGVGLRFLRELEQGKQSLRMDKVNQVLAYFGTECGVDDEAVIKQDIRQYRLSSLEEPQEYMLEEIMHQVCESAMTSSYNAHEVLRKKLEEVKMFCYANAKSYFCIENINSMSAESYVEQLSEALFWDMDKSLLDVEAHSASIIQRVLERGTLQDWRLTRDFFGMDRIVDDCKRLRTLDPMALSFICAMSDTNKEEYRCYQFKQLHPTLWNS